MKGRHHERPRFNRGPPSLILAVFSSPWCRSAQGKLSWGKRPGRGRAACTCSKPSRQTSPRGSRETGDQSRRSCSTSGPGCSRETCGRSRRTSSRSDHGEHQRHHHRRSRHHSRHRIRRHRHRHRSRRPACSCGQCVRPCRTCSTLGRRQCREHRPRGTRGKDVQSCRNGSKASRPGARCTLCSSDPADRSCSKSGCPWWGSRELGG
ncbi:hypothetical protein BC567DRAFT_224206 [Phyllosticta citribraziliensis]